MKNLKLILFALFAVLSAGLASCEDEEERIDSADPNEEIVNEETLIGTWQCIRAEGYERYTYNPEYSDEWDKVPDLTVTYTKDGTVVVNEDSGTWKLEGDKLTTTFVYRKTLEVDERVFTVLSLTGLELIMERSKKGVDYDYHNKLTFKKHTPCSKDVMYEIVMKP